MMKHIKKFNESSEWPAIDRWQTLSELRDEVDHCEHLLDGSYKPGMFDNDYKQIDELHEKTISYLRDYLKVLQNETNKIYPDYIKEFNIKKESDKLGL